MTQDFKDKIALITGASRGIGRALALEFAKQGAQVILCARTVGALEELDDDIQKAGGHATLLPVDLLNLEDVDKIGPTIAERFDALDILIGNAGMLGPLSPAQDVKPRDWERVMNLNFHANTRLVRSCDALLRLSPAGRIVFTSSQIAQGEQPYWGPYAASKAALDAFMRSYAGETRQTNMKINCIYPGAVDTKILQEAYPGGYSFDVKQPADVVPDFLKLCSEDCKTHGEVVAVD